MTNWLNQTHVGDCRALLGQMAADGVRVQTCVTSPPYFGLRDYGVDGQIGLEQTPNEYVAALVDVFRAVRDVLADDGTLWVNLGDSYAMSGIPGRSNLAELGKRYAGGGHKRDTVEKPRRSLSEGLKSKDLMGIPWRVAFALQADGWWLRSDIVWEKPNAMPESVTDRPTKAHEYVFLLAKGERYYYGADAIKERAKYPGDQGFLRGPVDGCDSSTVAWRAKSQQSRKLAGVDSRTAGGDMCNARSVWSVPSEPFGGGHFACFPRALVTRCILAGARPGDTVLDPFMGSGTTGQVATDLGRNFIGCELNPEYVELHEMRRTTVGMPW